MAPIHGARGGGLMLRLVGWFVVLPLVIFAVILVAAWALLKLLWALGAATVEVLAER
jgi:bacteriorhodopsin